MTPGAAPSLPGPVLLRKPRTTLPATSRRVPQQKTTRTLPPLPPVPAWAHNPPAPLSYARLGWQKVRGGTDGGREAAVAGAVGVYAVWYVATLRPTLTTIALWLLAVAYGLGVVWLCKAGAAPWTWTERRATSAVGALTIGGGLLLLAGPLLLCAALSILAAQAFAYRPEGAKDPHWWGEARMILDWSAAGILKADPAPWLRRVGPPSIDPASGSQTVTVVPVTGPKPGIPLGITADSVRSQRTRLEAVMGLRVGQLHISHDDNDEAAAITVTVTPPARREAVVASMPDRWDYNAPLPIGKDRVGGDVTRPTWGRHAGFVGMTGSGKTWFGRYEVAHALLDPSVRVFLIDGKGDDHDWTPMHSLCERVVVGSSVTAGRQALALLDELEALSESRKGTPDAPGIVLVVDEFYRLCLEVRRRDPKLADDLDGALTGLHATARSRRIRILTFWQAGTKDYISKAMRVNIGQRFIGQTESTAEVRYFLEQVPDHLPKQSGQFVYKDEGQLPTLVTVPALDREAFEAVCRRALALRQGATPAPTDPLTVAVHDLLALGPMKPSVLLDLLPEDVRPDTAQRLGYALGKMPGVARTTVGPKSDRAYELSGKPSGDLSAGGVRVPGPGASAADLSVPEARTQEVVSAP